MNLLNLFESWIIHKYAQWCWKIKKVLLASNHHINGLAQKITGKPSIFPWFSHGGPGRAWRPSSSTTSWRCWIRRGCQALAYLWVENGDIDLHTYIRKYIYIYISYMYVYMYKLYLLYIYICYIYIYTSSIYNLYVCIYIYTLTTIYTDTRTYTWNYWNM